MAEINDLEIVDASNTARFPEGQAAGSVNNGARALEGIIARFHEDLGCRKSTTGSADAYLFAAAQTIAAYYDGLIIGFDANFQNTGAATLNVDSLGAKTIKKQNDQDLASGDIEVGQKVLVVYDGVNFQMLSVSAAIFNLIDDTTPQLGGQLDVNGQALGDGALELLAFAETASAVNHVQIANAATGSPPLIDAAGDDANVALRLRGKGTGKVQIGDANLQWPDSDGTANQRLQTDGAGVLSFGSGLPAPDFISAEQTVTFDTQLDVAHGLGAIPTLTFVVLRNKTAELGWSVNDEIDSKMVDHSLIDRGVTLRFDATNVTILQGINVDVHTRTGFNISAITPASWKWVVRAWK